MRRVINSRSVGLPTPRILRAARFSIMRSFTPKSWVFSMVNQRRAISRHLSIGGLVVVGLSGRYAPQAKSLTKLVDAFDDGVVMPEGLASFRKRDLFRRHAAFGGF